MMIFGLIFGLLVSSLWCFGILDAASSEISEGGSIRLDVPWEFWLNISSYDPFVNTVCSTTHRYTGFTRFENWVLDCLTMFRDRRKAIAPFLVMTSLKTNTYFLEKYIHYNISTYPRYHDLKRLNDLYDEYVQVVNNYENYREAAYVIIEDMDPEVQYKLECPSKWHCGCLSSRDVREFYTEYLNLSDYDSHIRRMVILFNFIDPILRFVFILTGLTLNLRLFSMLIKYKDLRTESNIIVFNFVSNDVLYLIIYIPLQYIHFYYYDIIPHKYLSYNVIYIAIESTIFSVSAFSILALYFQRYFATSVHTLNAGCRCVFYILGVWIAALLISVLVCTLYSHGVGGLEINVVSGIYLGLLKGLPVTMFIIDKLTTRKLKKLDEERQAAVKDFISRRLVRALCLTYWFTHTPLFMWLCVEKAVGLLSMHLRFNYTYIEIACYYLLFLYPLLNAIVINCLGGNFKRGPNPCCGRYGRRTTAYEESFPASETVDTTI